MLTPWFRSLSAVLVLLFLPSMWAQAPASAAPGRVVLVLPFDNRSGNPALNWIGDSFPDTLDQRLGSAGFLTITRDDREYALDHLGLPKDFRPTRATTIRIAQTLDANYVVVGSYNVVAATGGVNRISVQAQVLEVDRLRLSAPLEDSSELARLFDIENAIAWKIARQMDPKFAVAQQTFLSASAGVRLSAFENYIRGVDAPTPTERTKRLESAVAEAPSYSAAQLALGKELYTNREFAKAAAVLGNISRQDRRALEANFYLGLARFNETKYAEAEAAFAFVASRLPLPEVVNDQGVALARQGKDAAALFERAVQADPGGPDYRYNLAVTLYRHGDFAGAERELVAALKLRPGDPDVVEFRKLVAAGRSAPTGDLAGFQPTERLHRAYSEASFRQAAAQLDEIRAMKLATLPPARQAAEYAQQGRDYLAQGLLPEAEQEFDRAIAAAPNSPEGHAGMAALRLRSDDPDAARKEATTALQLAPTAEAYALLGRLDLDKGDLPAAAAEVKNALHLDAKNPAALALKQALEHRGQSVP